MSILPAAPEISVNVLPGDFEENTLYLGYASFYEFRLNRRPIGNRPWAFEWRRQI